MSLIPTKTQTLAITMCYTGKDVTATFQGCRTTVAWVRLSTALRDCGHAYAYTSIVYVGNSNEILTAFHLNNFGVRMGSTFALIGRARA